jgi:hypothetical protein
MALLFRGLATDMSLTVVDSTILSLVKGSSVPGRRRAVLQQHTACKVRSRLVHGTILLTQSMPVAEFHPVPARPRETPKMCASPRL